MNQTISVPKPLAGLLAWVKQFNLVQLLISLTVSTTLIAYLYHEATQDYIAYQWHSTFAGDFARGASVVLSIVAGWLLVSWLLLVVLKAGMSVTMQAGAQQQAPAVPQGSGVANPLGGVTTPAQPLNPPTPPQAPEFLNNNNQGENQS